MPGPVVPMDVAMRFCISHSPPPLCGFLGPYEELQRAKKRVKQQQQQLYKPLRPCISSQQRAAAAAAAVADNIDHGCVGWSAGGKAGKKKVVFADTKGMSLTAIHIFSKFDDEPYRRAKQADELQFDLSDLEAATVDLKISPVRGLALDFKQPSADYLDFRNRLIQNGVCLENCSLQERSLTGTVKVRNIGFQKSVQLRATFDSWASFTDVPCTFMNNVYSCQDTDTFAFVLELPAYVTPHNRVEFCICFQVQDQTFWDNNDGKNYTLKHVGWNGEELSGEEPAERRKPPEMEFDQFGSPRMSSGLFPGWQSWGQIDSAVPYW